MVYHSRIGAGLIAAVTIAATTAVQAQNGVHGHAQYERIKGKPHMGYRELYETNLFFTPPSETPVMGRSRRLGTSDYVDNTCQDILLHNGAYCINYAEAVNSSARMAIPNGTYSMLVNESLFYVAPKVVQNVVMEGSVLIIDPELPIDYSTYFFEDWVGHVEIGDYRPASTPWYQTFVATGNSVRGVTFNYAGEDPVGAEIAILADNGDPTPLMWPAVAARSVSHPGSGLADNWVRFRSGEVPTVPGRKYAIRLTGHGGVNDGGLQPFIRRKDGNSYMGGQAFDRNGIAHGEDLNITVFSDNDGTQITMNKRYSGMGVLKDPGFSSRWGQTFVAKGVAMAAVDAKAAGGNEQWEIDFRWRIRDGGPDGPQIGPSKVTNAAWNAGGFHQGVSYNRGQVPLTPGQTYLVEFQAWNPPSQSPGFNPYLMENDSYADGHGYYWTGAAWQARPNDDVHMTIVEYSPAGPQIAHSIDALARSVYLGSSPPNDAFTLFNAGSGTLTYAISSDVGWCVVQPASGSSTGETDVITIAYTTQTLPVGTHAAIVDISGNAHNSPQKVYIHVTVRTVGPDLDGDKDVDQSDFGAFQACYSGSGIAPAAACGRADFDEDDDVDLADFDVFRACFSGVGQPADPGCM